LGVPVVVIAGDVDGDHDVVMRTLVGFAGEEEAWRNPLGVIKQITADLLADRRASDRAR
jgi:hypothetical protein